MFVETITPIVQDFVVTLVTALLGILSGYLIALAKRGFDWVSEKIVNLKDDRASKVLINAIDNLHEIVDTTVCSIQQSLAKEIRDSIAAGDGKYTREDLVALADKAYSSVMLQLTSASKEALTTAYADLESYVRDLIEAKVLELKGEILPAVSTSKVLLG